jgi:uroporphyrinogen-III synthase
MSAGAFKVWITRAEPGASATAERIVALGHRPVVEPLLRIEPAPDIQIDLGDVAALAFTSANGVRAFAERHPDRSLKLFAVGAGTAAAAKAAGFRAVYASDGDVAALARRIAARKSELKGVVLHPGAAEPAGDLVGDLTAEGLSARGLPLYDSAPTTPSAGFLDRLSEVDVVLAHSPKAAKALHEVLKKRDAAHLRVLCLSPAVARPLARAKVREVVSAPFPIEAALLNLIGRGVSMRSESPPKGTPKKRP